MCIRDSYKYIDLDGKNADGAYIYPREKFESRLRPDYEPKDDSGNIIYNLSLIHICLSSFNTLSHNSYYILNWLITTRNLSYYS